ALLNTDSVEQFLHELAVLAARTVGEGDGKSESMSCGMALRPRGRPTSATACSDPLASEADRVQNQSGDGPALDVLRHVRAVNGHDPATEDCWQRFCRGAASLAIRSCCAAHVVNEGDPAGALMLYARSPREFGQEQAGRAD